MTQIRLREGALRWREVEGQIVAIDPASREYLAVNRTGTVLWPALVEGTTEESLVQQLLDRFDVDGETASGDVRALVDDLGARGLLES